MRSQDFWSKVLLRIIDTAPLDYEYSDRIERGKWEAAFTRILDDETAAAGFINTGWYIGIDWLPESRIVHLYVVDADGKSHSFKSLCGL